MYSVHDSSQTRRKQKITWQRLPLAGAWTWLSTHNNYIPSDGKLISIMTSLGWLRGLIFLPLDHLVLLTPGGTASQLQSPNPEYGHPGPLASISFLSSHWAVIQDSGSESWLTVRGRQMALKWLVFEFPDQIFLLCIMKPAMTWRLIPGAAGSHLLRFKYSSLRVCSSSLDY